MGYNIHTYKCGCIKFLSIDLIDQGITLGKDLPLIYYKFTISNYRMLTAEAS